jgi:hypothetical protein
MNKEQIKQEAKERVKEHLKLMQKNYAREDYSKILATMVFNDEATGHAIKTIQKEIDLLEELAYSAIRTRDASVFKMLNTKLNNLKQVKTEIESM